MTLPQKLYDTLKFIVKFVPLLVAFLGTVLKVLNVGEDTINIILVILGAVGTLVQGLLEICRANHYKIALLDNVVIPVDQYDPNDEMTVTGTNITE